jgi:signal peptidase I
MKNLPVRIKKISALVSQVFFIILIVLGSGVIFHNVYYTPVKIVGASMEPTLLNNEFGIMDPHEVALNTLTRFDIVVVQQNEAIDRYIIKRVIGLPGDTLMFGSEGELYINESITSQTFIDEEAKNNTCYSPMMYGCQTPVTIAKDQYFLMGDNRGASLDSRVLGLFDRTQFIGKLIAIEGICQSTQTAVLNGSNCPSRAYQIPRFY